LLTVIWAFVLLKQAMGKQQWDKFLDRVAQTFRSAVNRLIFEPALAAEVLNPDFFRSLLSPGCC